MYQKSSDAIHRKVTNAIRGVEEYQTSSGSTVALNSSYGRVFGNGSGTYILTNNLMYNPAADPKATGGGWRELKRVSR